jgi:hypothetical protein
MAKRTTLKKRGGTAIGSGTDGCVFDKTFDANGNPSDNPNIVSKVFSTQKESKARQEFKIQQKIRQITNGEGVVVSSMNQIKSASTIKDNIPSEKLNSTGCTTLKRDIDSGNQPLFIIEYPRIQGDFRTIKGKQPLQFFSKAQNALEKLSNAGIIHTDIAERNIFVINTGSNTSSSTIEAAIGDFGSAIDLKDPNVDNVLVPRMTALGSRILEFFSSDQVTPFFGISALFYLNRANPEKIKQLKQEINDILSSTYTEKGVTHYDFEDIVSSTFTSRKDLIPAVVKSLEEFMKMYLTADPKDYIKLFKIEAVMTDRCMFNLILHDRCSEPIHEILWTNESGQRTLIGRMALLRLGGKRRTQKLKSATKTKH